GPPSRGLKLFSPEPGIPCKRLRQRAAPPSLSGCDLSDGRADPIASGLAIGIHIVSSGVVEVGDVRRVADEYDGGRKLKGTCAAILGNLLHGPFGCDCHNRI